MSQKQWDRLNEASRRAHMRIQNATPCSCPIRPGMTHDELIEEILKPDEPWYKSKNCHAPVAICNHLDRELRRADRDRQYKSRRKESLKKQGMSEEAAEKKVRHGKRGVHNAIAVNIDLDGINP